MSLAKRKLIERVNVLTQHHKMVNKQTNKQRRIATKDGRKRSVRVRGEI